MGFKALDEEKQHKIVELGQQGMDVGSISLAVNCAEGSTVKYLKKAGIQPRWAATGAMPTTPAGQGSQPPIIMVPAAYGAPAIAPSKLEERSVLSPDADLSRDKLRLLQNQLDQFQFQSTLKKLEREQPAMDFMNMAKAISELKREDGVATVGLAEELREVRAQNVELMRGLAEARTESQINALRAEFQQQFGILAGKLEHSSARIDELKFWRETAESLPSVIGRTVDETGGKLIERASRVGAGLGLQVGGAFGEPRTIQPITMPSHKVLTIEQRRRAQEVLPLPEQELEIMQQRLESELQEGQEPHRRDLDRERRLAEEVLKLRSELEQVRARKSPPPPVSPADMPRKVIRATQEAEPNVG
jgi:hypothetical protein